MNKIAFALAACIAATSISANAAEEKVAEVKQLAPGTVFNFVFPDGGKIVTTILKVDGISVWTENQGRRGKDLREYVGFTVGLGQEQTETMSANSRSKVAELFPLKVGNKSSFDHSGTSNGWYWTNQDSAEVVAMETITVPAGTFETFVIRTSMQNERWWGQSTCWYSPEIGYCAKSRWQTMDRSGSGDFMRELASFSLPK